MAKPASRKSSTTAERMDQTLRQKPWPNLQKGSMELEKCMECSNGAGTSLTAIDAVGTGATAPAA